MKFLTSQDIYGRAIGVHYDGEDSHKTRLGAFMTLVTYVLVIISSTNLIRQFVDKSAQKEDFSRVNVDSFEMEMQSLAEKEFLFGMTEYFPLPKEIGRWKAYQTSNPF